MQLRALTYHITHHHFQNEFVNLATQQENKHAYFQIVEICANAIFQEWVQFRPVCCQISYWASLYLGVHIYWEAPQRKGQMCMTESTALHFIDRCSGVIFPKTNHRAHTLSLLLSTFGDSRLLTKKGGRFICKLGPRRRRKFREMRRCRSSTPSNWSICLANFAFHTHRVHRSGILSVRVARRVGPGGGQSGRNAAAAAIAAPPIMTLRHATRFFSPRI